MPAQKRNKTAYAGVYFIWGTHRVSRKPEKIYYITYRKKGKLIDEKIRVHPDCTSCGECLNSCEEDAISFRFTR